jgi:hypothetical protein
MIASTIEHKPHTVGRRIGYAVTGLILALIIGPLFVIGAYTVLTSLMSL